MTGTVTHFNGVDAGTLAINGTTITATAAELNAAADVATAGTVEASKGVVVDADKDIGDFRNLDCTNLDAGASGTAGSVDVFPTTASKGKLTLACTDQTGDTAVTINANAMGQATTVNIADPGAAGSYVVQSTAALTLAEADFLDGATAGTQVASKAVIADANVNTGVSKVTELHIGATGSEVQVVATPAEINRTCDVSTRAVALTATAAITEALHEGKVGYITGTAAATYTLPEATGSGAIYRFLIGEVNTNGTVFSTADATNASFYGSVNILDLDAATQAAYAPAATDELMTLNGTTSGGAIGDYVQFIDMATDKWCVFAQLQCPTGSNPATPFSGV